MNPVLEIKGLGKNFRAGWRNKEIVALKDINLAVEAGETFGFIGPNGAGKSTTIKIVLSLIQPSQGSVLLNGLPVSDPDSRRGVGYVPENPSLPDAATPYEILDMALLLHRVRCDSRKTVILHWLEKFDLADNAYRPIRGFSKGMVQRTALAHALVTSPKFLILDEPLSGLDPIGRKDVVEILAEYRRGGGTIFLTSHVLHDVERLADRFGLIHLGSMRTVRTPQELIGGKQTFTVRSIGEAQIEPMQNDGGNRWYAEVGQDDVWSVLRNVERAGHQLIEVRPMLNLEQAFLSHVAGH